MSPRRVKRKRTKSKPHASPARRRTKPAHRPHTKPLAKGSLASRRRPGALFQDLVALQARLRAPGGCPWDREQTHETLKTYLIEEAYEVLDALHQGEVKELVEELGDLLLQILFHADIGREAGRFDISDVISGIHAKIVRRHPHVFGDVEAATSEQVLKNWAQLKAREKQEASSKDALTEQLVPSVLDGVSRSLPALLEAHQLTRRAAQVGFDWENVEGIFAKLREETSELRLAMTEGDRARREEELGDLLFATVNLARFLGFDPEVALKHSSLKFKSRFQEMEADAARTAQRLSQLSKEELEILWEAAKTRERASGQQGNES